MTDLAWFVLLFVALPIAVSAGLGLGFPRWPMRRITALAALPIPVIFAGYVGLGMLASIEGVARQECGVDSCGPTISLAYYACFLALTGAIVGLVLSIGTQWLMRL